MNRRHEQDLDRALDDMVTSRSEIETAEKRIPDLVDRHKFYQDLRGYITDLVDCYDEKLSQIKYLEEKYYKSKADVCVKIMERRREDVRDQMKELSASSKPALQMTQEEIVAEECRQRRAAEREGRRRRRHQARKTPVGAMRHADGMSSDDELPTTDQANVAKIRQDVENQARQVMSDVVDEFSTIEGVCSRIEEWKRQDPASYSDAFVQLCLPKIVSPLVRLQLLFWNPLTEHSPLKTMPWYRTLALYGLNQSKSELAEDPDRKLLSLVIEKVIVVKITNFVKSAYDPLSSVQTLKLTGIIKQLIETYPTVAGDSKQVRELLTACKDKLKFAIDNDVYIPIGYPKQ